MECRPIRFPLLALVYCRRTTIIIKGRLLRTSCGKRDGPGERDRGGRWVRRRGDCVASEIHLGGGDGWRRVVIAAGYLVAITVDGEQRGTHDSCTSVLGRTRWRPSSTCYCLSRTRSRYNQLQLCRSYRYRQHDPGQPLTLTRYVRRTPSMSSPTGLLLGLLRMVLPDQRFTIVSGVWQPVDGMDVTLGRRRIGEED